MRQKFAVQGQRTRMTRSCKFLYTDFQDFWVLVLLGFCVGFFFPACFFGLLV